jgi:hypothetical protein
MFYYLFSDIDLTIKLLTFNTQLLPAFISQNKPEQRAIGIAELIVRRKYDIVCLQGPPFHSPCFEVSQLLF